jgi:hypothetical protein
MTHGRLTVVGFRPGYPEISPRNKVFAALATRAAGLAGDDEAEWAVGKIG